MLAFIFIAAFVAGLIMFLRPANTKPQRLGEMLLFSSILAFLITIAPAAVKLLHN